MKEFIKILFIFKKDVFPVIPHQIPSDAYSSSLIINSFLFYSRKYLSFYEKSYCHGGLSKSYSQGCLSNERVIQNCYLKQYDI